MPFYADLHIHSKYSRATSRDCDLEHLALWARRKGLTVVATGDFTHPAWFDEIREKLLPAEPGLFRLRPEIEPDVERRLPTSGRGPVRFLLEVEISTIYKKGERTRKVHHLVYAPDLETAGRSRDRLGRIGNIASDGRPILGLDSRHLLEIVLESGPDAYLVPAHIWTPWFAVLGSSAIFALGHSYQGFHGMSRVCLAGLGLAALYLGTGSLWAPILLHVVADMLQGWLAYRVVNDTPAPPAALDSPSEAAA